MPREHRAHRAFLIAAAAVGLSGALVFGHATNTTAATVLVQLTNTVIGAGGQGDPTSARVPAKLSATVVPAGYDYAPVDYPATIALASSRDIGVPVMRDLLTEHSDEDFVVIAGYSEGTLVAEKVRGQLQGLDPEVAPSPTKLAFLFIASPFAPNGGIYGRFPGLAIPGVIDAFAPATPTRYATTYIANEYDPYADFPAYFNPLALANAALGVRYSHPDQYYDAVQPGVTPAYVTSGVNAAGGTDTYVLVYNQHLPLLGPLRELSRLTSTTPFTEPILSAIEPLLRVLIDMGYTDRVNANPATPTPFSFITPPAKFIEALGAVPGALGQGATNLLSGGSVASAPPPAPNLTTVPVLDAPAPTPTPVPAPLARQARLTPAPSVEPEPQPEESTVQTPTPTPTPSPSPSAPSATSTPTPTVDRLRPTVISDGNKFSPDETKVTGGASTPTGTTTTVTTGTTIAGTTPTDPPADNVSSPNSPESGGAAAA